jgi:hypothetical protein
VSTSGFAALLRERERTDGGQIGKDRLDRRACLVHQELLETLLRECVNPVAVVPENFFERSFDEVRGRIDIAPECALNDKILYVQ